MKYLAILLGVLLLIGSASAITQTNITVGSYTVVVFNGTAGTINWTAPAGVTKVDYLVIAGGGGGGLQNAGNAGGGGAGGFRNSMNGEKSGNNSVNETPIAVIAGTNYTVTVGGGGAENLAGDNSVFGTIISLGGGNGGKYYGNAQNGAGSGGSGGGAGQFGIVTYPGGSGNVTQGTSGGDSTVNSAAGGGGSGVAGQAAQSNTVGGNGGNGTWSNITGVNTTYAGGGGGSTHSSGSTVTVGGTGGGGNGNQGATAATAGTANTGSGGGGGGEGSASAAGGSGIVIIRYTISPYPIPSFTSNVSAGVEPLSVQFNDTSVTSITNWAWNFGEGNTSTLRNATNTFYNGNHYVTLSVTNASGSSSTPAAAWINVSPSGGLSGFNRQDIMMDQIFKVTFNIKDQTTHNGISGALVQLSNGDSTTADLFGSASFSLNYSAIVVKFAATGYQSKQVSYVIDRDRTETIYLSPQLANPNNTQNTWWTPHTVQITLMDDTYASRLTDVNITASYNQSSMPTAWVSQLYGIQSTPAADMVNSALSLGGTTGSDGTLTATMLGSLKYDIWLTSAKYGLNNYHVQAYPSDPMLNIYAPTSLAPSFTNTSNSVYSQLNGTTVYATEPDIYNVSMCINYVDTAGFTSSVNETWLYANNNTVIFNQVVANPGTSSNLTCITKPNVRGMQVWWGYNASRQV